MKIPYLLLFIVCTNSAYAAAPTLDPADYRPTAYQPVTTYTTTTPVPVTTTYAPSNYELATRINNLQNEVTQLKAKISDQSKTLTALKQSQEGINSRLTNWTGGAIVTPVVTSIVPVDPHTTASLDEKSRYENAYATFRNGGYDQAIAQFQSLQAAYPSGGYADNALYWMGEAYLKKGDKNNAAQAFDQVVRNYPKGGKVPDALLKQGMTQLSQGNKPKAKVFFDYLINNYPGTPAANIAITKKAQAALY